MKTNPVSLCGGHSRGRSHGTLIPTSLALWWELALRQSYGLEQPPDSVVLAPSHPLASLQNKNTLAHNPQRWKAWGETVCCPRGVRRVVAVRRDHGQARVLLVWEGSRQRGSHPTPPVCFRWDPKQPSLKQGRCGKGLLAGFPQQQLFSASVGEAAVQTFPGTLSLLSDIFRLQEAL